MAKDTKIIIGKSKVPVGWIIAGGVIGLIVLYVVARKVKTLFEAWKDTQSNKSEQQILALQGIKLTHPRQWYTALANTIYLASNWTWYSPNCDEATTMNSLQQIENDRDYLELVAEFGLKDGIGLHGYIDGCLNPSEKEQVNNIWISKGITKRL